MTTAGTGFPVRGSLIFPVTMAGKVSSEPVRILAFLRNWPRSRSERLIAPTALAALRRPESVEVSPEGGREGRGGRRPEGGGLGLPGELGLDAGRADEENEAHLDIRTPKVGFQLKRESAE